MMDQNEKKLQRYRVDEDIVFGKKWFDKHQKKLLFFANTSIGRKILGVGTKGMHLSRGKSFLAIFPSSIVWQKELAVKQIGCFPQSIIARNLYHRLKPLWFFLHGWDFVFGNFAKQLDFGFSTLTVYPVAGANFPIDAEAGRITVDEALATIIAGAGNTNDGGTQDAAGRPGMRTSATTDQWAQCTRNHYCFDTSPIAGGIVSGATLGIRIDAKPTTLGITPDMVLVASSIASTSAVANSDYGNVGSVEWGRFVYADITEGALNTVSLNASGIAGVSTGGTTKIAARHQVDFDGSFSGTWAASTSCNISTRYADILIAGQIPVLTVTYTSVVTTTKTIDGVSRIQKSVSQTETGLARITASTTKTIAGIADILKATLKTTTGVARIQKSVSQTIAGLSRIEKTVLQTITGISRITASATKTIAGVANINNNTLKTETGVGRIEKSVSKTQLGISRIEKVATQTETGLSRITATATKNQTGVARIERTILQTETGLARIEKSVTKTNIGIARIEIITAKVETGTSRITNIVGRTETGVSRITAIVARAITGVADIFKATQKTITGISEIRVTTTKTITGVAKIAAVNYMKKGVTILPNRINKSVLSGGMEA